MNPKICDKCYEFLNKTARLFMSEEEYQNSSHYGGGDRLINDPVADVAVWIGKNNVGRNYANWWLCAPVHPNCLSSDTRIFTKEKGFIYFDQLQGNETILSLNPINKFIEHLNFTEVIKYRHSGEMILLKGRAYDSLMTADHKLYYERRRSYSKGKSYSKHFSEARNFITEKDARLPRCPEGWISEDDNITIDEYNEKLNKAKLLGWILSEGYLYSSSIGIAQEKEKNFERIESIIKSLNLGYSKTERGYYLNACSYTKELINQGCVVHQHIRRIPEWIKNSSKGIIEAFLAEYIAGDGSARKTKVFGYNSKEEVIFTSSELMRDDLIECLLKIGKSANITIAAEKGKMVTHKNGIYGTNHTVWRLQVSQSKNIRKEVLECEFQQYDDYVFCVNLPKNHIFLIERNGKVMWTGNCSHNYSPFTPSKKILDEMSDELDEIFDQGFKEFTQKHKSILVWQEPDCSCHAEEQEPGEWIEQYLNK